MVAVLVVVGNHSPYPSSVANCTAPILDELLRRGYDVDVVTNRTDRGSARIEQVSGGMTVHRVDDPLEISSRRRAQLAREEPANRLKRLAYDGRHILLKLRYATFRYDKASAGWSIRNSVSCGLRLLESNEYAFLLSVSLPFKGHVVAQKIKSKKPTLPWFTYSFDPYAINSALGGGPGVRRKRLRAERSVFQSCDRAFITRELGSIYPEQEYSALKDKFVPVDYPNLRPLEPVATTSAAVTQSAGLLYAGQFYDDIRSPDYLLKVIKESSDDLKYTLMSNLSLDNIRRRVPFIGNNLKTVEPQSTDAAHRAIADARVLLNVGNTVGAQVPGKLFEYMSTGKPIVHFSKNRHDACLPYLKKYPRALVINEDGDPALDARRISAFCAESSSGDLTFDQVSSALGGLDSKYVAGRFVALIEEEVQRNGIHGRPTT